MNLLFIITNLFHYFFVCINVLPTYICATHCVLGTLRSQSGCPGMRVTDVCKPPHGCWELKTGWLQDKQVLLTN